MSVLERNNVKILGDGDETIVLAHGFGCDSTMWNAQLPILRQRFRIILFDHVGAGRSEVGIYSPHRYNNLRSFSLDFIEILDELGISRATFVGHSMSGMIGVLTQNERPESFTRMILIGASPRYLNDAHYFGGFDRGDVDALYESMRTNYYAWASGFAPIAMQNADRPMLAQHFSDSLMAIPADIALGIARVIFESDHREDIAMVSIPTLILQSRLDVAVPLEVGEYMARSIPGATLQVLNATGHFASLSAPDEVNRAIMDFI
jgi:sigma-B regulation protein RsbQ